jgi:hypothetical protein
LIVLEIQRFKSVKACRPKSKQAKVNANSSTNSLKLFSHYYREDIVKLLRGISKNSFFCKKVGDVSPKHRNGVYDTNKF